MIACYTDRRVGQAQRSPTKNQNLGAAVVKPTGCNPWALKRPTLLVLALLAIALPQATAQEKSDPAARAKVVAPFMDDQTVAVLHVDTSRMPVDALFAKAVGILPELQQGLGEAPKEINRWLKELQPIAGKDIYVVVSTADAGGSWYWYAPRISLIALKPNADEKAIAKLFDEPGVAKKRVGNFLLIAPSETMKRLDALKPQPRPELAAAFAAAGDTGGQILIFVPAYTRRVVEELMPELPKEIGGGPSTVLTRGIQWIAVGGDVAPQLSGRLVIKSQDAQVAEALRNKWVEGFKRVGEYKEVRLFVPQFDQLAVLLTPKVEGDRMSIALDGEAVGKVLDLLRGPIAAAREEAQRHEAMRQLGQIALAMLNYEQEHKAFPSRATYGPDGKPFLSWRVLILPYLDQKALYDQFHLNEPWDSPHNRTLIDRMPALFRLPFSKLKEPGKTNYLLPVGPGTVFEGKEAPKLSDIKDGTEHTILAMEADDQHAVVWTKPDDLPYDPKEPLRGLGGHIRQGFIALYCDGHTQFVPVTVDPEVLRAAFSAAAGDGPGP